MCASLSINTRASDKSAVGAPYRAGRREPLPEDQFLEAIASERRRSERSGRSFLLALVRLDGARWKEGDGSASSALCYSLCSAVRATDTVGWFREKRDIGVMFTELKEPATGRPQQEIDARLKQALCATFPAATTDIRITYHLFPEGERNSGPVDPVLYPEPARDRRASGRGLKRCMDIVGSLLALVVLSPLLLLIALVVKLTSEGPVWHRQTRVGKGGRVFTFLKFRTMIHKSSHRLHQDYVTRMIAGEDVSQVHEAEGKIYKIVDDPRVTPIGKILRRSSLDELPQFLNVLRGDMSLVGPRPPVDYEFECYSPWHRRRVLEVTPGLTGLWQVYGRSRTSFDEMVRLDLQYARDWSIWLDMKILARTPMAMLSGTGAH
jgi:lipopolysaccharide/colanic/teichoic acid biosynthesis glycosyltransferase